MSDVTGNLGGESIRLRGMALEDTQYKVLQEIEQLVKVTEDMAKEKGIDISKINKGIGIFNNEAKDAGESTKATSSSMKKLTAIINSGAGKAFSFLGEAVAASVRTVRNFDSNIDDASYSLRALSQNTRGTLGHLARFASESVAQLQDQYRSFKQMSDISGVMSSGFEDLRETANRANLTLDQYAGLMQDNFINLRSSGNLVTKQMVTLEKAVKGLNEDDSIGYLFNRLGINVNDYAATVLQMTALNRGLNEESVKDTVGFNNAIKKAVTTSIQLADAFGVQRSQMMQAQKKAQEDVLFERLFKQLDMPNDVKENVLRGFLGITGGDEKKAMQLMVGTMTGLATPAYAEYQAAGLGPLIADMKRDAEGMQKGTVSIEDFVGNMQKNSRQFANMFGDQANILRLMLTSGSNAVAAAQVGILDFDRRINKEGLNLFKDAKAGADAAADGNKGQLDALHDLQKQHLLMAVEAAVANKSLNTFGLTLAHTSQLLSGVITSAMSNVTTEFRQNPEIKKLLDEYNSAIKDLTANSSQASGEIARDITQKILDKFTQAREEHRRITGESTGTNTSSANTGNMTGAPLLNDVNVKTTTRGKIERMSARDLDARLGQHNQGGPTSPAIKQLIGVLAGSNNMTITGLNDAYGGRGDNSAHNKGLAVDFTLPAGTDYKKKQDEIYRHLVNTYGLDPNKDFKIFNEKDSPHPSTTGPHMHLEFSEQGASKFQSKFRGFFETPTGASEPGGGGTVTTPRPQSQSSPPPAGSGNTNTSSLSSELDTSLAMNDPISGGTTRGFSLNNRTSMVAIADETLLSKFDTLISKTDNMQNSFDSLARKLEGSTYSIS